MERKRKNPLVRREEYVKSDKFFVVATEDTHAAKRYFNLFKLHRVNIIPLESLNGLSAPNHVLQRIDEQRKDYLEGDEMWMVCDTDRYIVGTHIRGYMKALREARQKEINVAICKPCFEMWLLLHHNPPLEDIKKIGECKSIEPIFKKYLPSYTKHTIKAEDYPYSKVVSAIKLAKDLDDKQLIPRANGSQVYKLLINIINHVPRSSLPKELLEVKGM